MNEEEEEYGELQQKDQKVSRIERIDYIKWKSIPKYACAGAKSTKFKFVIAFIQDEKWTISNTIQDKTNYWSSELIERETIIQRNDEHSFTGKNLHVHL